MSDYAQYNVKYDDYTKQGEEAYRQFLQNSLRSPNRMAAQTYRGASYDAVANQTQAAENAIQDNAASTLGFGNTSGMTGQQIANVRQQAPYASAELAAREAGRQSTINTGSALANSKQMQANWYATLKNLNLQDQQIQAQTALGLAQLDAAGQGGGGSDSTALLGSGIGAVGSIASAYILATGGTGI